MQKRKAPALEHTLNLYNEIKGRGVRIFLISSRGEHLRDATIDNLISAGYHGWTGLILRFVFTLLPFHLLEGTLETRNHFQMLT